MGVRLIRGSREVRENDFSKKCLDLSKDFGIFHRREQWRLAEMGVSEFSE